ncbi:hypothetical protein KEM48_014635 [Puccinia striiformis f. sp. tritici PST-130]|nr:hypothetical protein KEM48_014635 [Puccinia striiformis f. sp. tritici PST-130]
MAPFKGDLDRHVRPGNEAGPYATTPIRAATQKCAAGFGDGLFPPERSRRLSADPAALSRGGRTGTCRLTTREPVTVCRHNLGGRPEAAAGAAVFPGRTANLAPPERPTGWPSDACRRHIGLAEYPVYDPQTGVARDPRVTEAAMCVRLVEVRITCGLHDDAQIAAVFIDPRAKFTYGNLVTTFTSSKRPSSVIFPVARRPSPRGGRITRVQSEDLTAVVQSVVATGGVYKGQGRNQRELMTRAYWEFLVHVEKLQATIPKHEGARVRPRTSKGITDLLSLSLVRLFSSAACPSKKSLSSWEPAVALVTYRDPPATAANAARFTTEPQARQTHADQGMNPGRRRPPHAGTRMARPRPTTAVDDGRTRSGIPGRADGNANTDGRNRPRRAHRRPGFTRLVSRTESRSLSELTRQIAPPTKNGHAPPPTESRKSSQSVNLSVSTLQSYFPRNRKASVSRKLPAGSLMKRRRIASWHRSQLELGRYLIAFEPLTFVLDHTRTYLANAFASVRLETIQEFHL